MSVHKIKTGLEAAFKKAKELKDFLKKKKEGFSLIELMIVVAIIGVLVAVAVPNFQVFLARAKQTEAKTNLGSVYTSQRSFHAEWNIYSSGFGIIGFSPEGNLKYRIYTGAGTNTGVVPTSHPRNGATLSAGEKADTTLLYCVPAISASCTEDGAYVAAAAASEVPGLPDATNFIATATSNLDGDAPIDTWQINQLKAITNVTTDF